MFGPLNFPSPQTDSKIMPLNKSASASNCLLCEKQFHLSLQQDEFLQHVFDTHKLVIADVHLIGNLEKYVSFWKMKFSTNNIQEFCSTVLIDTEKGNEILKNQEYFLLSDVLPEDRLLRESLQQETLKWVLEQQRFEREDHSFSRICLFCQTQIMETRADYLDHLSEHHNLQLGHPHNLVFVDKLIDKLQEKMNSLQCFYCEKIFKDKTVLKEHMRKKFHKRINPDLNEYDRFYIVNYLEPGKSWKDLQQRQEQELLPAQLDEDAEWGDWTEDTGDSIVCLLCPLPCSSWNTVNNHMSSQHNFSYEKIAAGLDFYQEVKLVNYIRRQVHRQSCIICDEKFYSNSSLLEHMKEDGHLTLPHCLLWDQPEYYFPTYENDLFLCQIEDTKDIDDEVLSEKMSSMCMKENQEVIEKVQKLLSEP